MIKPTSKNDVFLLQRCTGGLGNLLNFMLTDLYTFCYYITFKKELKTYVNIFKDPFDTPIDDPHFFDDINDPVVQHINFTYDLLIAFYQNYKLRHGLLEELFTKDHDLLKEAQRYTLQMVPSLKRKSYCFMKLAYERFLESVCNVLYYYCCVLTLNSYLIPVKMRVTLDYTHQGSFRYLNIDNNDVALLTELILSMNERIVLLKALK